MLTEVSPGNGNTSITTPPRAPARPAWWARLLARIPLRALYGLAGLLGYPLDAAYKPLVDNWAEREMRKVRTRFGSRLVPAQDLLADIIKRHDVVRAVALVADQEPTTSEHKYWTRFLNRDTAFYLGPEELARVTRLPVF